MGWASLAILATVKKHSLYFHCSLGETWADYQYWQENFDIFLSCPFIYSRVIFKVSDHKKKCWAVQNTYCPPNSHYCCISTRKLFPPLCSTFYQVPNSAKWSGTVWKWKWRGWISDNYCSFKTYMVGHGGGSADSRTSLTLHPPSPATVL